MISLLDNRTMGSVVRPRHRAGPRGKFAERLRAARTARALTQQDAADELEVTRSTLALWETGSGRPVGPALLYVELWVSAALDEPIHLPGYKTKKRP